MSLFSSNSESDFLPTLVAARMTGVEKLTVILDMGRAYVKAGFAGEGVPRTIFPSPELSQLYQEVSNGNPEYVGVDTSGEILIRWSTSLGMVLRRIIFESLLCKPKEVAVVICEQYTSTTMFRRACANVLLNDMQVQSMCFVNALVASMYTTGSETGIVIDIGSNETRIAPIVDGVAIHSPRFDCPIGANNVLGYLREYFAGTGAIVLGDHDYEEMLVRCCFVPSFDDSADRVVRDIPDFLTKSGASVPVSGSLRSEAVKEIFFSEPADAEGLVGLVLKGIEACPIDARKAVVRNIVLTGGLASLPGFGHRLVQELQYACETVESYHPFRACMSQAHIVDTGIPTITAAWVGAAIMGSLKALKMKMIEADTESQSVVGNRKRMHFDTSQLTRDTVTSACEAWEERLKGIGKSLEQRTTSPQQRVHSSIGGSNVSMKTPMARTYMGLKKSV